MVLLILQAGDWFDNPQARAYKVGSIEPIQFTIYHLKRGVPMEPTRTIKIEDLGVQIDLFGKATGDWSIKGLIDPEQIYLAPLQKKLKKISRAAQARGALRVLSPRPHTFNARVCLPRNLRAEFKLNGSIPLYRGLEADGVVLQRKHDSFFIGSADCPTLVLISKRRKRVVATHAGRDCLVDREWLSGKKQRTHHSVVLPALAQFSELPEELSAIVVCGSGPENFRHPWNHPTHGERNRMLIEYIIREFGTDCILGDPEDGCIDVFKLIRSQLVVHGVSKERVLHDGIDTHSDHDGSDFLWHSHSREANGCRNGVLVTRM